VPDDDWAWLCLAATYGQLGHVEKAGNALQHNNELRADLGWGRVTQIAVSSRLFRWQGDKKKLKSGLKTAGTPTGGEWYSFIEPNVFENSGDRRIVDIKGVTTIDVSETQAMHDRGVVFVDVLNTGYRGISRAPATSNAARNSLKTGFSMRPRQVSLSRKIRKLLFMPRVT